MKRERNHLLSAEADDVLRRLTGKSCVFCGDAQSMKYQVRTLESSMGNTLLLCASCRRVISDNLAARAVEILERRLAESRGSGSGEPFR